MSKKTAKAVSGIPAEDPTMPKVSVTLSGKTYHLAFTFAALNTAEQEFKKMGSPINIFQAFDFENLTAQKTIALLYAAMVTDQPETALGDVPALITMRDIPAIREALIDAFNASMADPDKDAESDPLAQA